MTCARAWVWRAVAPASDRDSGKSQQPPGGAGTDPGHPSQPKRLPFLLCSASPHPHAHSSWVVTAAAI